MREIRWQRVEMSKQAKAEWLVSSVLEEAGSDDTASRRGRKGQGIESLYDSAISSRNLHVRYRCGVRLVLLVHACVMVKRLPTAMVHPVMVYVYVCECVCACVCMC